MLVSKKDRICFLSVFILLSSAAVAQTTSIKITIPEHNVKIDPMLYGQMLENVNDSMIYRGVVDSAGNERLPVTRLLKDLDIPVMRWPGGTVIHEYRWRNGIGPKFLRPSVQTYAWKGPENYQFGTDEFLQWCRHIGTAPYINFNMGNSIEFGGTLWEALEWMEYTNGSTNTPMGKLRASNGHPEPYNVKYWCIGNENYGPWGRHTAEKDTAYARRLEVWSGTIKNMFPKVSLLAIGHTLKWNREVLAKNGKYIDFLTQHYYVTSKLKDGVVQNPYSTLFAPAKMEAHLKMLGRQLDSVNQALGRTHTPIRLSIDEWNNRHSVFNNSTYRFSRQSPRQLLDAALVATMLNVFIRQSPTVGMANYIFPVNAHGLVRTVGNHDAFVTPPYYVFQQYRRWMTGRKLDIGIEGPGITPAVAKPTIEGDTEEVQMGDEILTFIDAASVLNDDGNICVSLVNKSVDVSQKVVLTLPTGFRALKKWTLAHKNIHTINTLDNRDAIKPTVLIRNNKSKTFTLILDPCSVVLINFF